MKPLLAMNEEGKGMVSNSEIREIFSAIEIIEAMHRDFLLNLEKSIAVASTGATDVNEARVGDVFIQLVDCLRLYQSYISNYDKSIEALSVNLEKPKFRAWIDEQHDAHETLFLLQS